MRKYGLVLGGAVLFLMAIALVEEVNAQKKGTGGGGFGGGGFGGFGQQTALNLLNRADVKKELEISDEQMKKIPDEVMVAISRVLDEKQFKRFKQIELQQRGNNAFKDEAIQKKLNINETQKTKIDEILEASAKEVAELNKGGKGGFGGFGKGNQEKIDTIRSDAKERIMGALTKAQRKMWAEMVGEEFKFQQGGFGGFGGFGKDKKAEPKKDAKKDVE